MAIVSRVSATTLHREMKDEITPRYTRVLDLMLGIPAWFIAAPIMLIIAGSIRIALGKGVFFRQLRPGLRGKPFKIFKFRTMNSNRDANGDLLQDHERLTQIGKLLRSNSLDELPELFNVLKGEMSLVGPRPLLMQYLDRYSPEQKRRHEVKPGITGWAQINGRNAITWEEKFRLDIWYLDHRSLELDVKILAATLSRVFKRQGISHPGHATMEEFTGSPGTMPCH